MDIIYVWIFSWTELAIRLNAVILKSLNQIWILTHLQVLFEQALTLNQLVILFPALRLMGCLATQHFCQSSLLAPGLHFTVREEKDIFGLIQFYL